MRVTNEWEKPAEPGPEGGEVKAFGLMIVWVVRVVHEHLSEAIDLRRSFKGDDTPVSWAYPSLMSIGYFKRGLKDWSGP